MGEVPLYTGLIPISDISHGLARRFLTHLPGRRGGRRRRGRQARLATGRRLTSSGQTSPRARLGTSPRARLGMCGRARFRLVPFEQVMSQIHRSGNESASAWHRACEPTQVMSHVGIWALRHIRRQGYEASKVDSLKPRKYIHLGLVDWKLSQLRG